MKTKTQLKNTNSKRSIAMKKSWAERRNSPGRKLARERQAKKVTRCVTKPGELDLKLFGSMLEQQGRVLNEIRTRQIADTDTLADAIRGRTATASNGSTAHLVEVSKRLDELGRTVGSHVARLTQMEQMRHLRNEAAEQRIAKLEEKLTDVLEKLDAVAEGNLANHNRLNKVEDQIHTEIVRLKRRRK